MTATHMAPEEEITAGRMLRGFRRAAGESLRDWARSIGVSHVLLGEVERGLRAFPRHWISNRTLAAVLDPADHIALAEQLIVDLTRASERELRVTTRGINAAIERLRVEFALEDA